MSDAGATHRSDPNHFPGYAAVAATISRYTGIRDSNINIGAAGIVPESVTGYRRLVYGGPHPVDQVFHPDIDIGRIACAPVRDLGVKAAAGVRIYDGQLPAVIAPGPPPGPY